MIDFAKLSRPTSLAEREANEASRITKDIATDRTKRLDRSKHTINVKLSYDAESRFTMSSDMVITMRGTDDAGHPVAIEFYIPSDFKRDATHAIINRLTSGASVTLTGYWKAREYNGKKMAFKFIAQFLRIQDETFPNRD